MKELVIIAGPTASGKTALSVELAKYWNTIVVSADSRQFYKEMSIGTAKPTLEEMNGVQHYFIDSHSIEEELNVANYAKSAEELLVEQFKVHDKIILTGGSGMFIDALVFGLDDIPHDALIQQQLNEEFQEFGIEKLLEELSIKDPVFYDQVDRKNPIRVIRALEVIRITGNTFSSLRKGNKKVNSFKISYFNIDIPRDILYERINMRVDLMLKAGLENEVYKLISFKHLKSLATVGYSEWFDYFDGKKDYETTVNLIKQNSRRYAKRQVTWFKRNDQIIQIPYASTTEMKDFVVKYLTNYVRFYVKMNSLRIAQNILPYSSSANIKF